MMHLRAEAELKMSHFVFSGAARALAMRGEDVG